MGSVDEHISRDPASVSELSKSKQKGTLKYKSTISKSTLHDRGITKTVLKERAPTKEEMEKCEAWLDADEIEGAPFTWRDQRKLMKDREDEYIKKEVEMVNSSLRNWTTRDFNLGIPAMEVEDEDDDDFSAEFLKEYFKERTLKYIPPPEYLPLIKPKDDDSDEADIDCPELMMRKLTVG